MTDSPGDGRDDQRAVELLDVELLELAARLAVEAGRMVDQGRRSRGVSTVSTKSTATDMVTEFDRASEELIVSGILDARPDDGIVGEEGTDRPGTSGVDWLIDPIDGTTNFLYGLPGWGVSIAARTASGTRAGVVYVPSTDELFRARVGHGAFLGDRRLHCSVTAELPLALVATGFSYRPDRRAMQAARMARLLPQVRDVRRLGAAAPDLCHVAAGRVDAYFEQWLGPWDVAAGLLIAAEAGCTIGAIDGGPVHPDSVLVSTPALHAPLRDLLAAIDAERDLRA